MSLKCSALFLSMYQFTSPHLLATGDGTRSASIVGDVYIHPSAKVHPTAKVFCFSQHTIAYQYNFINVCKWSCHILLYSWLSAPIILSVASLSKLFSLLKMSHAFRLDCHIWPHLYSVALYSVYSCLGTGPQPQSLCIVCSIITYLCRTVIKSLFTVISFYHGFY